MVQFRCFDKFERSICNNINIRPNNIENIKQLFIVFKHFCIFKENKTTLKNTTRQALVKNLNWSQSVPISRFDSGRSVPNVEGNNEHNNQTIWMAALIRSDSDTAGEQCLRCASRTHCFILIVPQALSLFIIIDDLVLLFTRYWLYFFIFCDCMID